MLRSSLLVLAVMFTGGCSLLPQMKRSESIADKHAKTSTTPISQLGMALPAMKPGDERELKIIAADQMTQQGYWSEAVALYREAEAMAPKKATLDAQLAPALAGAGQYTESLQRYRRLIQDDPQDPALINNFAFTLMESGDQAAAESEFRRALAIDPQMENAGVNLGLLLARQHRYDEALATLTPAIGAAAAYHNLGVIAIELGDELMAHQQFTLASNYATAPQATQDFLAALSQPQATVAE